MTNTSVPKKRALLLRIYREALTRYRHELMGEEERLLLEERLKRLHRRLAS